MKRGELLRKSKRQWWRFVRNVRTWLGLPVPTVMTHVTGDMDRLVYGEDGKWQKIGMSTLFAGKAGERIEENALVYIGEDGRLYNTGKGDRRMIYLPALTYGELQAQAARNRGAALLLAQRDHHDDIRRYKQEYDRRIRDIQRDHCDAFSRINDQMEDRAKRADRMARKRNETTVE